MQSTGRKDVEVVLHISDIFARLVRPKIQENYGKRNNGKILGAYVIDKDGNEKLLDDIIRENGSFKATDGTK